MTRALAGNGAPESGCARHEKPGDNGFVLEVFLLTQSTIKNKKGEPLRCGSPNAPCRFVMWLLRPVNFDGAFVGERIISRHHKPFLFGLDLFELLFNNRSLAGFCLNRCRLLFNCTLGGAGR